MKDLYQELTGPPRESLECCQCGEDVPEERALDHPKDPDAWVHIDCPAHYS